jgi:hypothetical protein
VRRRGAHREPELGRDPGEGAGVVQPRRQEVAVVVADPVVARAEGEAGALAERHLVLHERADVGGALRLVGAQRGTAGPLRRERVEAHRAALRGAVRAGGDAVRLPERPPLVRVHETAAAVLPREVAVGAALGALEVLRVDEERGRARVPPGAVVGADGDARDAVAPVLVAARVEGVGLPGVGGELRGRERPRDVEQVVGREQRRAHGRGGGAGRVGGAHRRDHAGGERAAPRVGARAVAGERGAREGAVHRRGVLPRAQPGAEPRHVAAQAEAPGLRLQLGERAVDARHGRDGDDAAGGVAPQRARVRPHDLDAFGGREVDVVERGAPVGLGLGHAVDEHAHAARGAGVGAVAGAARAEAADDQPHVARPVARLREHARDERERLVEADAAAEGVVAGADHGDGGRDVDRRAPGAGRRDRDPLEARDRVAGAGGAVARRRLAGGLRAGGRGARGGRRDARRGACGAREPAAGRTFGHGRGGKWERRCGYGAPGPSVAPRGAGPDLSGSRR